MVDSTGRKRAQGWGAGVQRTEDGADGWREDVSDLTRPNMRAFNTVTFDADGKQVVTLGRTTVNYHEDEPEDLPDEPPPGWPSDE